jgi:hypothetical protein
MNFRNILAWFRPRQIVPEFKVPDNWQTPNEKLYRQLAKACPECQRTPTYYHEGPAGGANVNIFCAYCGQGYNISPMIKWAEKIRKDKTYINPELNK